jgi:transposase
MEVRSNWSVKRSRDAFAFCRVRRLQEGRLTPEAGKQTPGIGRTKGGLKSKLHTVCDGNGRPLVMLLSEGQMSDYKGAALMLPAMPKAKELLADKGYDADWFRAALAKRGLAACIPSKSNRKVAIPYDAVLYKQRHRIENMFGRLKDWRRIHTRYDRCAHTYLSAICIAAAVAFWP